MCNPHDPRLDVPLFVPELKCCTYPPTLPNFAVGGVLKGGAGLTEAGRAAVQRRVEEGRWATPLALEPAPGEHRRYKRDHSEGFGRDPEIACPYLDQGRCGIWSQRNAVCSTWWCQTSRRALGQRARLAEQDLLQLFQETVATWCARELGIPGPALVALHEPGGRHRRPWEVAGWERGRNRELWGDWYKRRAEYYEVCAERASRLSADEVRALAGMRGELAAERLLAARAGLEDPALPEVLCPGNHVLTDLGETVGLTTEETVFDPLILPTEVMDRLDAFDGRSTTDAIEASGLDLDVVMALFEQGVLGPPGFDVPPRDRPSAPLRPEDRLNFFSSFRGAEPGLRITAGEGGAWVATIAHATREIEFDELDLVEFGRKLVEHRHGFEAGEVAGWAPPGVEYPWERVVELLDALCEAGVLQRLPTNRDPRPAS